MSAAPDVVVVGAACRDLVDDDERGWRLGGGASYSALALARLGLRVGALVVADREAATSREMDTIREAGVDVRVIPGSRGPIFINVETPTGRIQQTPQVSDHVDAAALPPGWRGARAWSGPRSRRTARWSRLAGRACSASCATASPSSTSRPGRRRRCTGPT
jgi:hypothetical protein